MSEAIDHQILFSGSSLYVGQLHWYIQRSYAELNRLSHTGKGSQHWTDFGKEVLPDEIHWWIFKKEDEISDLKTRTTEALASAQKLKEDSLRLSETYSAKSYSDLTREIKAFTDNHLQEIMVLLDFVIWLQNKDILAPCILYTYRVWGSTRLTDFMVMVNSQNIDEDPEAVKVCTETALGLRVRYDYTLNRVHSDMLYELYESDPEGYRSPTIHEDVLATRTSHKVLHRLADYFEQLRDSLRNILIEIELFNAETELLHQEAFWRQFVDKAMDSKTENQLWDFKQTLDMWHSSGKAKEEAQLRFSEQVAAFANTRGGVLIIGVSDNLPRKLVGIQDIENRLKYTKEVIGRFTGRTDFVHFQQIAFEESGEMSNTYLVVAVAQTEAVIPVKDRSGRFSYPIRLETGMFRSDYDTVHRSKISLHHDNYGFILDLERGLRSG